MSLPNVFIGSSTEHLPTARALAERLRTFARPMVWKDAPFELNESIFHGLLSAAENADYAVFIFDGDDVTRVRRSELRTVRDNVLFEFGLFVGKLGKGRTFWISANRPQAHHIPADLQGITHLSFDVPETSDYDALERALQPATERLRLVVHECGRRSDRAIEELEEVSILCVASSQYDQPAFARDLRLIRDSFPDGSIKDAHGVPAHDLYPLFSQRDWDVVHLAMYVDPSNGDLLVPDSQGNKAVIPADGVDVLISMCRARLVVVVTCDSLILATRLARHTSVIAGHQPIAIKSALTWSAVFYPALAQGVPLSEAFNRAQKLADPGLLLLAKRNFRLALQRPLR